MNKTIGIVSLFARHRVAANLLMMIMLMLGVWALLHLNVQFLPTYNIEVVSVNVPWRGASAEDIERSITNPLELELRDLDHVDTMTSTSQLGNANIVIEFDQGTDMGTAVEEVRDRINQYQDLPPDSEEPIIKRIVPYEPVAKLLIVGQHLSEIIPIAHRFERELLDLGISKIDKVGLPEQEIAIQVPMQKLVELQLSLGDIADRIAKRSEDFPAGTIAKSEVGRQLRSLEQRRDIRSFEQLPIISGSSGRIIRLGNIATIAKRPLDREVTVFYQGKPAIELRLLRSTNANALKSAEIFHQWLKKIQPQLGKSVSLHAYDETWLLIKERIDLLLKNGFGGLVLILIVLFLLLNRRVAFWVAAGIPVSFMAALGVLNLYGGTINMVSLFALIMTLGIIVDDTIVVGEEALTNIHRGHSAIHSVETAAKKMLAPIFSSSFTTICAFLPLFLITGIIGTILFAIPLVVVCVIIASLIECFLVLPGHLSHSFKSHLQDKEGNLRCKINARFKHFKENNFHRLITWALKNRAIVLASALALLLLSAGLVIGGHINFTFFPSPEGKVIHANIQFTVGTPPNTVKAFAKQVEDDLYATSKALSKDAEPILQTATVTNNRIGINNFYSESGEQYATVTAELSSPDSRKVSNAEFIKAWQDSVLKPPGLESFTIVTPKPGPPGEDIDIEFHASDADRLKNAAIELENALRTYAGVSDIRDDLPFGQEQLVFSLSPTGKSLGLTIDDVGRQLRAAYNGQIAETYHDLNDEIEVRVMLPDRERYSLSSLTPYPILTPRGESVPLGSVVKLQYRRGPDVLHHTDSKLTTHVTAQVNYDINNANKIIAALKPNVLADIINKYNVQVSYKGKAEEQEETLADMKLGLIIGLSLIYIILAWVFSSYGWPLVVMAAIPLGLTGAILGHLFMRLDLTILSLFGLFGLSGIVINDSIILLSEYKHLKNSGMQINDAIIEASSRRLRAVLLTSLTTIAGLTPLLFETSRQAQFLIPMATSISFGLAYATLLILVIVPVLLSYYEQGSAWFHGLFTKSDSELPPTL